MNQTPEPQVRFGCRLELLPGNRVIDQLNNAGRFGFETVGLPGRFLSDFVDELRDCVADSPVPLSSLSLGFEGSLVSPDPAVRRRCADSLRRLFDLCAELGVPAVNMPPCLVQDNPVRVTDPGDHASLDRRLDALLLGELPSVADAAAGRGVKLLLEPVNQFETEYLRSVRHGARLCAALNHPGVGLTADTFHMQMEELDPPAAILEAGPWIGLVHVAENTRDEPGPGSLDFPGVFTALRQAAYTGVIEIEARTLTGPPEVALPRSCRFLRETWNRAAGV